jgi:hypothetical protein
MASSFDQPSQVSVLPPSHWADRLNNVIRVGSQNSSDGAPLRRNNFDEKLSGAKRIWDNYVWAPRKLWSLLLESGALFRRAVDFIALAFPRGFLKSPLGFRALA